MSENKIDIDDYLVRGLGTLVRACDEHWVFGHNGASVMSAAWMLRDGWLPEVSAQRLAERLRDFVERVPGQYVAPPVASPDGELNLLIDDLAEVAGNLRNSAHGTIFVVAAMRLLRERPELVTIEVVDGLRKLLRSAQLPDYDRYLGIADHRLVEVVAEDGLPHSTDPSELIVMCLKELEVIYHDEAIDGKRYFFAGEKFHIVTHLHALLQLGEWGYRDVFERGIGALRLQMKLTRQVPPNGRTPAQIQEIDPANPTYWRVRPGADPWHDIKFAQAVSELLPRLSTKQLERVQQGLAVAWSSLG